MWDKIEKGIWQNIDPQSALNTIDNLNVPVHNVNNTPNDSFNHFDGYESAGHDEDAVDSTVPVNSQALIFNAEDIKGETTVNSYTVSELESGQQLPIVNNDKLFVHGANV